jgi:hypothetical protein
VLFLPTRIATDQESILAPLQALFVEMKTALGMLPSAQMVFFCRFPNGLTGISLRLAGLALVDELDCQVIKRRGVCASGRETVGQRKRE